MATTTLLRPAPAPPEHWNTLQILKAGRAALIALDVLLLIAGMVATRIHRDAIKTVGKDAAPSIIAAQHIKSALADMDANAANELLGAPRAANEDTKGYEARREEAARTLISAAENITYGELERDPIVRLQLGLGTYERLIQKARDLHERSDAHFVDAYRDAARLMDETVLPAADALDKANNDVLETAYESQSVKSTAGRGFLLLASMLSLGGLVIAQFYLSKLTRRTLNPLLVAATLVLLGAANTAYTAMSIGQQQLRIAKEDGFHSIRALWRARAIAYQAHTDESRYLLDQAHAADHERSFAARTESMAKLPSGKRLAEVVKAAYNGIHVQGFSGHLADELNNITFPGEREAAVKMLMQFEDYLAVDQQIRLLARGGKLQDAINLCTGTKPGQSDFVFDQFDQALGATLEINQKAFTAAVESGFEALDGLEVKLSVAAGGIAVLIFLGLAPRIREYE